MATETVPMDDKELFSAAMAPEPVEEATPEPVAEAVPTEQPRDEHGRFVPKTEAEADAAPTQQQPEGQPDPKEADAAVPSWRLRELREERDALRRQHEEATRAAYTYQQQMAEMRRQMESLQQPKPEPVDFFADPDRAFKQQLSPVEERLARMEADVRMGNSRAIAVARHGWEAVAEMERAVGEAMSNNDPEMRSLGPQIANSPDPVGTAMQWFQNSKVLKETGGDISKFREKILADAMKDPAFQAKVIETAKGQVTPGSRPNIQLPPSISRLPGSGVTTSELNAEDMSDGALFRHAVGSPRR